MTQSIVKAKRRTIEDLKQEATQSAVEVYKTLGAGYEESVYAEAMEVEFRVRDIPYEIERNTEIFYKDEKVGMHRLDFILDDQLVVELKAVGSLTKSHTSQLGAYLRTLKLNEGMLVNFPDPEKDAPEIKMIENGSGQ